MIQYLIHDFAMFLRFLGLLGFDGLDTRDNLGNNTDDGIGESFVLYKMKTMC